MFQFTRNTTFSKQHLRERKTISNHFVQYPTTPVSTVGVHWHLWHHLFFFFFFLRLFFCTYRLMTNWAERESLLSFPPLHSPPDCPGLKCRSAARETKGTATFDWSMKWALPPDCTQTAGRGFPGWWSSPTGQSSPGCTAAGWRCQPVSQMPQLPTSTHPYANWSP